MHNIGDEGRLESSHSGGLSVVSQKQTCQVRVGCSRGRCSQIASGLRISPLMPPEMHGVELIHTLVKQSESVPSLDKLRLIAGGQTVQDRSLIMP